MKKAALSIVILLLASTSSFARKDSLPGNCRHYFIYAELFGHNYYSFNAGGLAVKGSASLNVAYRTQLKKSWLFVMGSAGWGAYRDQLNRAEKSWINFFPVEFALQVGSEGIERHYFEIGVGSVVAFGKQEFVYERASGGGPWYERSIVKNTAIQFFPRLGYSFFGYNGFMLRFAFTPHLYPGSYDNHENAFLVKHAVWISMGASFGWTL